MFEQYAIPDNQQAAFFKNIPITMLDEFRDFARHVGLKCRIVYRGPRGFQAHFTLKSNALRFSIYRREGA